MSAWRVALGRWRDPGHVRSVRGQLELLGWVLLGAAVLAVALVPLRSSFFEGFVREKPPAADEGLRLVVDRFMRGEAPPDSLLADQGWRDRLYRLLASESNVEAVSSAISLLRSRDQDHTVRSLHRTLVVGSSVQRLWAATAWNRIAIEFEDPIEPAGEAGEASGSGEQSVGATAVLPPVTRTEILGWLRSARQRAARRGENDLASSLDEAIDLWSLAR